MQVTFQEVVGGARELLVCACYAHMHMRSRLHAQIQCAKVFTVKNDLQKNFANGMHWRNWQKFSPGRNFRVCSIYTLIPFLAIMVATRI